MQRAAFLWRIGRKGAGYMMGPQCDFELVQRAAKEGRGISNVFAILIKFIILFVKIVVSLRSNSETESFFLHNIK